MGKLSKAVEQRNTSPSGTTKSQLSADSPALSLACSQNLEDRGTRIVINDGVLAGIHGLRLQSHGSDRCLVQLENKDPPLLVEIDKTLVERTG